jgi:hypothetical protein
MPIKLTSYELGSLCKGYTWEIDDEESLVELVAKVLLGRQRQVQKILNGITGSSVSVNENAVRDAILKLTLKENQDPWHRDGLVFQIFSWIAAQKSSDENAIIAPPHLIPAHKGFDGLKVDVDSDNTVSSVVVFEDKATTSPRDTIREKVWPEFAELDKGNRESEIEQEVANLIASRPGLINDIDLAIENIIWKRQRKYRVSITADAGHMTDAGLARLFAGYEGVIPGGDSSYRVAECVHIPALRDWMDVFCNSVVVYLNSELAQDV